MPAGMRGRWRVGQGAPGWLAILLLCLALCLVARAQAQPRVITLSPSATELVAAAGAVADLVGTDHSSNYPDSVRFLPRVGDASQLDDEAILALRPTLVVGWQPTTQAATLAARLRLLGVPLVYANPKRLEDIPRLIRELGARLGTAVQAARSAQALEQRIAALHAPDGLPQTVFIEVSARPLYTLGNDPLIDDMLARCGGVNPYAASRIAAPQVSTEAVLHLDPDVVIISPWGRETLAMRRAWWVDRGLRAAREGRLYAIDPDWLHRPGPRLIDAAQALCRDLADSRRRFPAKAGGRPGKPR